MSHVDVDFSRELAGKRVLVTGGAGFIGSNVVETLCRAGAHVIVLDNLVTGSLSNIDPSIEYECVDGSVAERDLVAQLVIESDYVLHLAALNIIASTKNPRDDYETNIGGTLNVLTAARKSRAKRIVYSSSASVYGNSKHLPISEDEATRTFSPYAVSKLAGENYCHAFYETYGVPVASLRYSNVYGEKQQESNPYCGVVAKFVGAIDRGEEVPIHGDGQQTRDFTYVGDVVEATLMTLLSPKSEGLVMNVGSGIESSVLKLAEEIGAAMGRPIAFRHVNRRDIDNIRRRVMNIELIRTRVRWQPRTSLREGIRRTVSWYRAAGVASEHAVPARR